MPGFAPPAETRLRGAVRRPPSPGAFRRSQRGRRGQRPGRGPEAAATGAPRPPFRPPAAGPAFTCCGRNRVRGRRPRPGRPFPQRRPSSPDARTDGPADRRAPRVATEGLQAPTPKARAPGPPGARGPPGRARPPEQASGAESRQPATGPPPSLGAPATRGPSRSSALPRGFWSLPLAVLPSSSSPALRVVRATRETPAREERC